MIEAAGLGGEYQVHAGCGQGLLLRRTHRRRLRSGAPMQSRASPRRARRSWFGLAAVLGAGQLGAMPCAGNVHEPAPGINKISASARRRVAPAGADGRSRRAAGGLAARDRFIAPSEARPGLLLWVSNERKEKSAPAAIPALRRPGMRESRRQQLRAGPCHDARIRTNAEAGRSSSSRSRPVLLHR